MKSVRNGCAGAAIMALAAGAVAGPPVYQTNFTQLNNSGVTGTALLGARRRR